MHFRLALSLPGMVTHSGPLTVPAALPWPRVEGGLQVKIQVKIWQNTSLRSLPVKFYFVKTNFTLYLFTLKKLFCFILNITIIKKDFELILIYLEYFLNIIFTVTTRFEHEKARKSSGSTTQNPP